MTENELGWLTGIIDGEGCFNSLKERDAVRPTFSLASRYDDYSIQKRVKALMGCGIIQIDNNLQKDRNSSAKCTYKLFNMKEIIGIAIPIFDACSFISKKASQYKFWRELALMSASAYRKRYRYQPMVRKMLDIHENLKKMKWDVKRGSLNSIQRFYLSAELEDSLIWREGCHGVPWD